MKRIPRNERGMALAVAIFALVVVGALVAGAFFAGTQEQRVGENQRRVQTSFGVAEAGADEGVLTWDPNTMNKRPVYPADSVAIVNTPAPNGTGSYAGYSFRVGTNLFLIDVTGRDNSSAAGAIAGGGGAAVRAAGGVDAQGDPQRRQLGQVLQRPHHPGLCSIDLEGGAGAGRVVCAGTGRPRAPATPDCIRG